MWRTAYKLTKIFGHPDTRGPLMAATTMKARLEKFKINMPLINALCNSGIKERHWNMMNEKVKNIFQSFLKNVLVEKIKKEVSLICKIANISA